MGFWAADFWDADFWDADFWGDVTESLISNLKVMSLDLGGISQSITWKGSILPIQKLVSSPSGAPPSGKGVVFYIDGGVAKIAIWDGAAWVTT